MTTEAPVRAEPSFDERLRALAASPVLLVATDYDGTLAPIVDDPAAARADREALVALARLATLAHTHVSIISGRSLADLVALSGDPPGVRLVGSHGSEFEPDFAGTLTPKVQALRERVERELAAVAARFEGAQVESKAVGAAFHYRRVDPTQQEAARDAALAGPGALEGVFVRTGKCVVELCVVATDKGTALDVVRRQVGASAAIFAGDDATDEDAFRTLKGPDLAVKVGDGESCAPWRVDDTREVARLFARLYELRSAWLLGAGSAAIADHALLSDERAVALVEPRGRVNWLCAPSIDSQALFSELLGGPAAGHFTICPADAKGEAGELSYDGDTLIARTRFEHFDVVDYLDASMGRPGQRPGRTDLVRVIEPRAGATTGGARPRVWIEFAPRLDYGRYPTQLRAVAEREGLALVGALQPIVLHAPGVPFEIVREGQHESGWAEVPLGDEPLVLELRYGTSSTSTHPIAERERRARTAAHWSTWSDQLVVPDAYRAEIVRSALTLRGLCHGPSGGVAAAATTSLPECIGGVRNWDYRFTWIRDAALTVDALVRLGSQREAMAYLDWLHDVLSRTSGPEHLRPLYMVSGQEVNFEAEIGELSGYAGSRPVRVGNAAASQVQLDVFGPIASLVYELALRGAPLSHGHWQLVEDMVRAVERRWHEPDHGIWEVRRAPRHHVHSRAMCWLTLDRATKVAALLGVEAPASWTELRERIAAEIAERGYSEARGAFTAAYDGDDLDAAVLLLGPIGLVAPDDPRFRSTIAAIEAELLRGADRGPNRGYGPTLLRYDTDDGLPGSEGGFHILTLWLADAYLVTGDRARAEQLYRGVVDAAGSSGLLSEQLDPESGGSLGNHPQAYSHLAVIHTALRLADAFDAPRARVR